MSCPDLLILSQHADGELSPLEAAPVDAHVESCASCQDRLERLGRAISAMHAAVLTMRSSTGPRGTAGSGPGECLSPEQISGWVRRVLPSTDLRDVEAHLHSCDTCLDEVLSAEHLMMRLDAKTSVAVPQALTERMASRWGSAPAESLTRLVIRIARAGAALLERHIVAPVLEVEPSPVSAPALRAGGIGELVSFRLRAADAQIRATIVPQGDAVRLVLRFLGNTEQVLSGQRVFLRRHGRSIYSARTDAVGRVETPRIEPGVYEVSCPAIGTSFRLDLRS